MNKTIIIIAIILVLGFITNPSQERHKEIVLNKFKPEIISAFSENKDLEKITTGDVLGFMLGSSITEKFLDNLITVDNYYFFSLTNITWNKQTKTIGIGFFGNILFFKDLEKFKIRI